MDHQAYKVHLAQEVPEVMLVQQDRKDRKGLLVLEVEMARSEQLAHRVQLDQRDLMDHLVIGVLKVIKVIKDLQEIQDSLVLLDNKDQPAIKGKEALTGNPDHKADKEIEEDLV